MSLAIIGPVQSVLNQATTQAEWAASFVSEFGTGCKLIWYQGSTPRVTLTFSGSLTQVGDTVEIGPTYAAQTQSAGTPDRTVLESSDGSKTAQFSSMLTLTGTPGSSKGFTLDGAVVIDAPAYLSAGGAAPIVVPLASITLTGRAPGIADLSAPEWDTVPTITFAQGTGGSVDVTDLFNNAPSGTAYTHTSGTLPTGVTFEDGVYTYDGSAAAAGTDGHVVTATTPASSMLPDFTILSTAGGTNQPFTFGHVFAQGDVPAGNYITSDLTDWQAVPTTYWPDGSVRHAIISGRATTVTDTPLAIALDQTSSDPGGTDLTETDLASALPTTTLVCGAETITLGDLVGTGAKHRTVVSGPVMSNWLYRKQLAGSNHLVAWFDVRLYLGGAVEVFPWVENGYFLVSSPATDTRTYTFTMGAVERFSASIAIPHHTRVVIATGQHEGHWSTDPEIVPQHDMTYFMSTKMVPNYGWLSPSSTVLNSLQTTYSPNTLAGINSSMGVAGTSAAILHLPSALYITSGGDARAWKAALVHDMSGGSWPIHYRDEATNEPFLFASYPTASIQVQDSPTVPTGTGGNGSPTVSHEPAYGYLGWLCTGRWYFLDEMLLWGGYHYLWNTVANRMAPSGTGADGVIRSTAGAQTDRGAAWGLRTLAQALVSMPESHTCFTERKASWAANMAWYKAYCVDGTTGSGVGDNDLGVNGFYGSFSGSVYSTANSSTNMYGAGWMQAMVHHVLGFTWDLELPVTETASSDHAVVRDHGYTMEVARADDGQAGRWSYRNFIVYSLNWGTIGGTYYSDWSSAYAIYKTGHGITATTSGSGQSLFAHSSETDLAPGSSSLPYFGQALASLAYAVDHGKTGAAAGWARVAGASNFDSYTAAEFNDDPVYAYLPRSL